MAGSELRLLWAGSEARMGRAAIQSMSDAMRVHRHGIIGCFYGLSHRTSEREHIQERGLTHSSRFQNPLIFVLLIDCRGSRRCENVSADRATVVEAMPLTDDVIRLCSLKVLSLLFSGYTTRTENAIRRRVDS